MIKPKDLQGHSTQYKGSTKTRGRFHLYGNGVYQEFGWRTLLLVLFRCWTKVTASSLNRDARLIHLNFQAVERARFCFHRKGEKIFVISTGDEVLKSRFEVVVVVIESTARSICKFFHNFRIRIHRCLVISVDEAL